jgi:hypothetical protein
MIQGMFSKKYFLIVLLAVVAPFAQAQQYYDTHNVNNNDDYFIAQWRKLKNSITNCHLELSNLIPLDSFLDGINIMPQYEKGSDIDQSNIAKHHSSVDIWKLKTQVNSEFFNLREILGMNIDIGKEVIYIQQFESKAKAVLRMPYNPLNKIPLKSEMFFKKNDDSSLVFKEGDLLIFKAPMILNINKSFLTRVIPYLHSSVSASYALAGVFNVQVFRMKNNFIRVTITNSLDKSIGVNFGLNILDTFMPGFYILGFDLVGSVISKSFLDQKIIQFSQLTTNLVNHNYDFIFNLNSEVARRQYDLLMGPKLNLFGSKNYEIIKRASSFYKTKDQISKNLEIDFKDLVRISGEDEKLRATDRRIIAMSEGESRARIQTESFEFNLLQVFKWRDNTSDTKSLGQSFDVNDQPKQSYTFLSSTNGNSMDSFFKWRSRERIHTNIIFDNDENNLPTNFKYLHQEIYEEDRTTSPHEFKRFKELFLSDLPVAITKNLAWPDWYTDVTKRRYATLRKEVFINDKLFKSHIIIPEDRAKKALQEILALRGMTEVDSAYLLRQLPRLVASIFNGLDLINESSVNQYKYLELHLNKVPVIREIGIELILKCLSEEDLLKVAYVSIELTAQNTPQTRFQFPRQAALAPLATNLTAYKDYVSYNQTLGQYNFINDKSYRLWLYFNRDGSIIDLNQIVK